MDNLNARDRHTSILTHREIGRLDTYVIHELCVLILHYRYIQYVVQVSTYIYVNLCM